MHYRLYFLDAKGHVREGRDLDCANDDEARQTIRGVDSKGRAMELWQAARKLDFVPPRNVRTG
jgi:hypothetical protein